MKISILFLLFTVVFFNSREAAAQPIQLVPKCYELNRLWVKRLYFRVKPAWGLVELACGRDENSLNLFEKINMGTARVAYVLDRTQFTSYEVPQKPIVYYGRVQAAPASMLDWFAARVDRLVVDTDKNVKSAYATVNNGIREVHITLADFGFQNGLSSGVLISAQFVHEAQHLKGHGHVQCRYGMPPLPHNFIGPPSLDDTNCDETISEEFEEGGAHGVGLLWLTWIATRSRWSQVEKDVAKNLVRVLLRARINDTTAVKNAYFRRYFGENL